MRRAHRIAGVLLVLGLGAACGDAGDATRGLTADQIPVAHTPPGGFRETFPEPVLARCTEPLIAGAPDLRGLWRTVHAERMDEPVPDDDRIHAYVERIEQCGDRIVDMGGGTISDARADGTEENGVHDVSAFDYTTPLTVIATYEDRVFVLRPAGIPGIEVTRRLARDGDGAGTPVNTFFPYQPNAPAE
jgi:hypothetical protein